MYTGLRHAPSWQMVWNGWKSDLKPNVTRKPGRSTGSNRREKSLAFNNAKRHVKMTQVAKASCISRAGGAVTSARRAPKSRRPTAPYGLLPCERSNRFVPGTWMTPTNHFDCFLKAATDTFMLWGCSDILYVLVVFLYWNRCFEANFIREYRHIYVVMLFKYFYVVFLYIEIRYYFFCWMYMKLHI